MQHLHPETHQYYFERYLREKLTAEEKAEFEQRLANDEELQEALKTYKTNRKQFLKEIIQEQKRKPAQTSFINFIYLTITIVGIVITLNFYWENKSLKEERKRDKNLITRLIDYIPFIEKKGGKEGQLESSKKTSKKGSASTDVKTESTFTDEENLTEEEVAEELVLILDSVWVPVPRDYFNDRLDYFLQEVDSTLTAQEILSMIYRNSAKGESRFKSKPIGIKIWKTTHADSYNYDGHLLNLYFKETPEQLSLINDQGELVWLHENNETILMADNALHPFSE